MEIIFKKTTELTEIEKNQICQLFFRVFSKEMSIQHFINKFQNTLSGFSYHGLMINDNSIVGCYSVIPYRYMICGESHILGLSVDTMIDQDFRGSPFNLKKMAQLVYSKLELDNIPFVFGFPNENVYLVRKKILKWKDIGELDFFILPLKVGALWNRLKFLNPIGYMACQLLNLFSNFTSNAQTKFPIEKIIDDQFNSHRYDLGYDKVELSGGGYCLYKRYEEDGIDVSYIIDVVPLTKNMISLAVKAVSGHEAGKSDVIIYIGKLPFTPVNLIKVPKRFHPKPVRLSGKMIIPNIIDDKIIFDINNWNVNLSNYDVR